MEMEELNMYTEFCRGCVNYTVMDDGTELCLNDEEINIHDLKVCPDDGITEEDGRYGYRI
jgi:hypothetical protein